ncbi:MAG: hypothetical protein AAB538_06265 [Patescibacteria group bacterium]
MQLCETATVQAITLARESVEQYLRSTFDEIGRLQTAPDFLDNVEKVQEKTRELDTWRVQREQLSAMEECAKSCTCDEGAQLVIEEYNSLAEQADKAAGLVTVPLPSDMRLGWGAGVVLLLALIGLWFWRRAKAS